MLYPMPKRQSENFYCKTLLRNVNSETMATKFRNLVFVYGTLKQGEPNHHILKNLQNGSAKFICKASTQEKWPLVIASRYNIPYILFQKHTGKHVIGELYEVDDTMLTQLDELECHPKYYERIVENVQSIDVLNMGKKYKSWIYFLKNFRSILLELPYLDNYTSRGDHGLPYVERYNRQPENYYMDILNFKF